MTTLRNSPSGPRANVQGAEAGIYTGTWDGVSTDPTLISQKITLGFRPKSVTIFSRQTTNPPGIANSGVEFVRNESMTGCIGITIESTQGFQFIDDSTLGDLAPLIEIEDDGFTVSFGANLAPGISQAGPPALPDFYTYQAFG